MKRAAVLIGILLCGGGALALSRRARPAPVPPTTGAAPPAESAPVPLETPAVPPAGEQARAEVLALLATPNPARRWGDLERALSTWAEHDARTALAFVHQAPRFPQRTVALAIPLGVLARTEPAVAASWIRTNGAPADRRTLVDLVVSALADESPRSALVLLGTEGIPAAPHLLVYTLGRLAATAPDEATARFETLPPVDRGHAAMLIGTAWAEHDPEAALRWCASLRGQPAENAAAESVLVRWCDADPAAAAAALVQLQPPREATVSTIRALADADPELALRAVPQLAPDRQSAATKALVEVALGAAPDRVLALGRAELGPADFAAAFRQGWENWRDSDRPAAEAWADGLSEPLLRAQLAELLLNEAAHGDPALFLSAVEAAPDAPPSRQALASALGNLPAAEAARWLAAHPSLAAPAHTAQLAERFAQDDRDGADRWAQTLPAGEPRDRALATVASQWGNVREPARANAALARIDDPIIRTAGTYQVFTTLHNADPAAARRWLEDQPLAEEVRISWEAIALGTAAPPEGEE